MAITCPVVTCGRPMPATRHICSACVSQLDRDLEQVPELAAELETARARQTRMSAPAGGGTRGDEHPLPWSEQASEAAAILQSMLIGWARLISRPVAAPPYGPLCSTPDQCGHQPCIVVDFGRVPHHAPAQSARWLRRHLRMLTRHSRAAEAVYDLVEAVRHVCIVIDAPERDRVYAGPCRGCGADLYALPGAATVTCHQCYDEDGHRISHGVAAQRQHMLAALPDLVLPAAALARALTSLDLPVTPERIYTWVRRGRIHPCGTDSSGHATYRVHDVIACCAQIMTTRA